MTTAISPLVYGNSAATPLPLLVDMQEHPAGTASANCGEGAFVDQSRGNMVTIGSTGESSCSMAPGEAFHRKHKVTVRYAAAASHAPDQNVGARRASRGSDDIWSSMLRRAGRPSGSLRPGLASLAMAFKPME